MRPSNIYNESIRKEIQNMIAESGGGGGSTGREVPSVTSSDNGKVLKATYSEGTGSYGWVDETTELPSHTSSNRGQFLGVNKSNDNLGWKDINQVPDASSATSGQVVTADGSGGYAWADASGGDLPNYTTSDYGKVLSVALTGPTSAVLQWQSKIYVPSSDSSMQGEHLKVGRSGNATWAWENTVLATSDITTTEGTNNVVYTVTLPTLIQKSIYYGMSERQIFYEDVIIPINTQVGIDNKTIVVNFANLPSGMKIEPIEVILNGYETTNYTMESKIDNVSVDMGNFVITTKLKTSDMYGTDIRFLVIKNINETVSTV